MLRLSSSRCPFCEARAVAKSIFSPWQHFRTAATLQKRRPSRSILSSNVRRGPPPPPTAEGWTEASRRKSRNSPFGGMNITAVPRGLEAPERNQTPRPDRRRTARRQTIVTPRRTGRRKNDRKEKDAMHALKMQRALANISYEKRGRIKQSMEGIDSFYDFDLLPVVKDSIATQALAGMQDISPTPVQRIAIPALLGMDDGNVRRRRTGAGTRGQEMEQFLLAAETGSGKTLAYLLPVIDALKRAELLEKDLDGRGPSKPQLPPPKTNRFAVAPPTTNEPDKDTARPRAILLVPTSELVTQIGALLKSLSHTIKLRTALLSSSTTGRVIRSRLFTTSGIDIVITTPHLLHSITDTDPNVLSRVTHLVIDEADSLLDRSFAPTTSGIIDRCSPSLKQLILCSATIPRSLDKYLQRRFPEMRRLVTPNLHAIPRRVQLSVVDIDKVPFQGNRDLACAQVVWDILKEARVEEDEDGGSGARRARKILVFVNEREKCGQLATYLQSKGIDAVALERDSEGRKQGQDVLSSFTGIQNAYPRLAGGSAGGDAANKQVLLPPINDAISPADIPYTPLTVTPSSSSATASIIPKLASTPQPPATTTTTATKTPQVLISTDLTSRGIDTLPVKHVVLYHVPHTTIDFIHRLGRVGRLGRRGRGVVLVGKGDRRDIVKEVRGGMFGGRALI